MTATAARRPANRKAAAHNDWLIAVIFAAWVVVLLSGYLMASLV